MEFRVLGPLEVVDGTGRPLQLGGRKARALLARLLLEPNRTVSVERLVEDLWGETPPGSAVKMIHIHVSALRKVLPPGMLRTRHPGYALDVDEEAIDVTRFDRLRAEGHAALEAGDPATAATRLRDALALRRGVALSGFVEPFAQLEAAHLEERQLVCLEQRVDADLALGRHSELVGELEALVRRHPLRERLREQLMLALYRSGRQAEALATYRELRTELSAELGLEPSARIRRLEGEILRQDVALEDGVKRKSRRNLHAIRYTTSVGGFSIAYQTVGDGPLDLVFVHGWVCSFQAAWEWPALAAFYRRLAGLGRLILFDKRGTGLSDRVHGIASLEERMDDLRAVLDAVGSERAVVLGVSEGGPMAVLFAATHPDRTVALITMGAYARRSWAPDYPIGRHADQDSWLRPTPEQWGRFAGRRFLEERAPSVADDEDAIRWYASYLTRGASPTAVAQITDMNDEIDVRPVLGSVRVPALVLHREHEYMRDASRYVGAALPGAQVIELPGRDHLPWEGSQEDVLDAIERFVGGLDEHPAPDTILTTVLDTDRAGEFAAAIVARFRGIRLDAPVGRLRASFDGPARAIRCAKALAELAPELRAGLHTGECERHGKSLSGPAPEVAARAGSVARPGEILVTSTVHDLVAGSRIEFSESGTITVPLAGGSHEWRLFRVTA
jgi:DNA-binding SARP family transcriptional activator/pimeloyl-ACP methyl ester carboxylesterase